MTSNQNTSPQHPEKIEKFLVPPLFSKNEENPFKTLLQTKKKNNNKSDKNPKPILDSSYRSNFNYEKNVP